MSNGQQQKLNAAFKLSGIQHVEGDIWPEMKEKSYIGVNIRSPSLWNPCADNYFFLLTVLSVKKLL